MNNNYKKLPTRKRSMETILVVFIVALVIVTGGILSGTVYSKSSQMIKKQVQNNVLNLSQSAAACIDGKLFASIPEEGMDSTQYKEVWELLSNFRDNSDIQYIYTFRLKDKNIPVFVVDTDEEEPSENGAEYEMLEVMKQAFAGEAVAENEESKDEWGSYLSGFAPIFDGNKVVGIVGVDVSYSKVLEEINQFRRLIVIMAFLIFLITAVGVFAIIRKFRAGVNILNDKVLELSQGDGDLNREVELRSGDEFEIIAESINGFIREVRNMVKEVADKSVNSEQVILSMNGNVANLNQSMQACSTTAELISSRLNQTTTKVTLLAEQVTKMETTMETASLRAKESSEQAVSKKEKATEDILKIKSTIDIAYQDAKAVDEVLQVTSEISKFATQIRLLSLNAQVEASRAGEAGKGFAIVAEEMQHLNEKITESVTRISAINETVVRAVNALLEGCKSMQDYLSENVLVDYDDYADVGSAYGDTVNSLHIAMKELNKSALMISNEVMQVDSDLMGISDSVANSTNQIIGISNASMSIAQDMKELTEEPMLRMVQR